MAPGPLSTGPLTRDSAEDPDGLLGAVSSAVGSLTPVRLGRHGPVLVTTLEDSRAVLTDPETFPIPFNVSRQVSRPAAGAPGPDTGRARKPTPTLEPAAVAAGRATFVAELATAWPTVPAGAGPDVIDVTVDTLDLLRAPVARSTTAALVPQATPAQRDHIGDLTLRWVDALKPVITATRPPRRWSRARRDEQQAQTALRAALRAVGESSDAAVATALAAGIQVPIAAGAWVLTQLAVHPVALAAARTDQRLQLALVWETLRLFPPTWFLPRVTARDCVVGETELSAITAVIVSPRVLGQLPTLVPGPEQGFAPLDDFDPTRWHSGEHRPGAWLPFGGGPHACPGRNLALAQLTHLVEFASGYALSVPGVVRIDASRGLAPLPALVRVRSTCEPDGAPCGSTRAHDGEPDD